MKIVCTPSLRAVNRGAITLIEAGIYFIVALIVIVYAFQQGGSLFSTNDASTELSNAGTLLTNGRSMLKTNGTYNFSSSADMTGALIEFGGAPDGMQVNGVKGAGNATLTNVWGSPVTLEPVTVSGGLKTRFSVTYNGVPLTACTTMATKMSNISNVVSTSVNGTVTNGPVDASDAGTQCKADDGSSGVNVLIFTSNT